MQSQLDSDGIRTDLDENCCHKAKELKLILVWITVLGSNPLAEVKDIT